MNYRMTSYKYVILGAAAAGVALVVALASVARAERPAVGDAYKPSQAIVETFGSKQTVGYFSRKDGDLSHKGGSCSVTLFVSEAASDGERIPTAARVRVNIKAGEKAELAAAEGQAIEVACSADAASVEVRRTGFKAAYVTQ